MCALQIQHMRVSSASSRELSLPLHKLGLQNSFTLANMQPCWRGKKKKKRGKPRNNNNSKAHQKPVSQMFPKQYFKKSTYKQTWQIGPDVSERGWFSKRTLK